MNSDDFAARARERRARMVVHKASSFAEADAWDLSFWQGVSPEQRLDAYMALREDVETVQASRAASRDPK